MVEVMITMKRIQVQLTGKRLDDVVTEMANEATRAVMQELRAKSEKPAIHPAIRQSIRKVLEKYVHAYNICGLSALCGEATEVDPWTMKDQDED